MEAEAATATGSAEITRKAAVVVMLAAAVAASAQPPATVVPLPQPLPQATTAMMITQVTTVKPKAAVTTPAAEESAVRALTPMA